MRSRFFATILALGLVVPQVSHPRAAWADDEATATARARFKEGVELYDKGDYERARSAFLQAYSLKKHPAVLMNLAWSCFKSGHNLEAAHDFQQLLTEEAEISEKQRADASDGLNQASAKLGHIEIVAPSGTDVRIDAVAVGVTPLAEAPLVDPGPHAVELIGPDGAAEMQNVSVAAGGRVTARSARAASTGAPPPLNELPPPPAALPLPSATAAVPPPPIAPAAPPVTTTTVTPPQAPAETSPPPPPPASAPPHESHGHANKVVLITGGAVTLASTITAITMLAVKESAQSKANSVGSQIVSYSKMHGIDAKNCAAPVPASIAQPCSVWGSDNRAVDGDAIAGNVALGIAIAAAAGTAIYWIVADRSAPSRQDASRPVLLPFIGNETGGLFLSGSF